MNERIQELHNQARNFYLQDEYMNLSIKDLHRLVEEKFAKFILSECAGLLEKDAESNYDEGTDENDTLILESKRIKQHFGVEP